MAPATAPSSVSYGSTSPAYLRTLPDLSRSPAPPYTPRGAARAPNPPGMAVSVVSLHHGRRHPPFKFVTTRASPLQFSPSTTSWSCRKSIPAAISPEKLQRRKPQFWLRRSPRGDLVAGGPVHLSSNSGHWTNRPILPIPSEYSSPGAVLSNAGELRREPRPARSEEGGGRFDQGQTRQGGPGRQPLLASLSGATERLGRPSGADD